MSSLLLDGDDEQLRATYAGAKRRIAALELQLQTYQEAGSKRKKYVLSCVSSVLFDDIFVSSDIVTSVNQGRVICRLVSMFDSVDFLVDESDRRRALVEDMLDNDETPE